MKAKRITKISQSSGPIYLVADETVYKEWDDIMERAATIASSLEAEQDSGNINRIQSMATLSESFPQGTNSDFYDKHNMVAYLQKSEGSEGFHQIIDFLTTSHISTLENGDMEITATIDGKVKVVSKASIRRHLKLEYFDGISTLPTSEIFKQLALMGDKHKVKSSKARRRVRLVVSEDEDELEDPSKQGRKIAQIDKDECIPKEVQQKRKDKGKAIMKEAKPVQKKTKLQLEQERLGLEEALRLQEQLDEEEKQRIARVHEEASTFNAKE
ncbi:hypothetical protein Tco_0204933 [Tanacetum coccineum]